MAKCKYESDLCRRISSARCIHPKWKMNKDGICVPPKPRPKMKRIKAWVYYDTCGSLCASVRKGHLSEKCFILMSWKQWVQHRKYLKEAK